MESKTNLTLNMQLPNYAAVAHAVQGDSRTRRINATLVDGSEPWFPPDGALAVVRYVKPDGTVGFYDTIEGGGAAVVTSGNSALITLAQQAFAVSGEVIVQLNYFTPSGEKITTFNFRVLVQKEAVTDMTITSTDYFNVLETTIAEGIEVARQLTFPVPIANGGTGSTTAAGALENLQLGGLRWRKTTVPSLGKSGAAFLPGTNPHGLIYTGGRTASSISVTAFYYSQNLEFTKRDVVASSVIEIIANSDPEYDPQITIRNLIDEPVSAWVIYSE